MTKSTSLSKFPRDVRERPSSDETFMVFTAGFLAMLGGIWVLSRRNGLTLRQKTWIAVLGGSLGGHLLSRFHKPLGLGVAAGLGGLGLLMLTAQIVRSGKSLALQTETESPQVPLRVIPGSRTT